MAQHPPQRPRKRAGQRPPRLPRLLLDSAEPLAQCAHRILSEASAVQPTTPLLWHGCGLTGGPPVPATCSAVKPSMAPGLQDGPTMSSRSFEPAPPRASPDDCTLGRAGCPSLPSSRHSLASTMATSDTVKRGLKRLANGRAIRKKSERSRS
jgi:hypothetical protein